METFKIFLILIALLTSLACTVLLFRSYFATRVEILLWTALCFVGLSFNCFALFADVVLLPDMDLRVLRLSASLAGMLFLIFGFIRETH
jgi:hypothetical protein